MAAEYHSVLISYQYEVSSYRSFAIRSLLTDYHAYTHKVFYDFSCTEILWSFKGKYFCYAEIDVKLCDLLIDRYLK